MDRKIKVKPIIGHTEELLASAALLQNLNETGLELLDGGDVVGENTHLTSFGGDVDLDTVVVEESSVIRSSRIWR